MRMHQMRDGVYNHNRDEEREWNWWRDRQNGPVTRYNREQLIKFASERGISVCPTSLTAPMSAH